MTAPRSTAVVPQPLFRTAREIASLTTPKPDWILPGFIAAGALTELTGAAKRSGKTTFVASCVGAIADGAPCLGTPTSRTPVVFLTEQSVTSFREVLRRAGLLGREDVSVLTRWDVGTRTWPVVAKLAKDEARRIDSRLIVVDTLPQFAGLRGESENNSGDALAALEPLQRIAAAGIAVLLTRHERKGGGQLGDSGRGSSAFTGGVDIVLSLTRPQGNHRPTIRVLEGMSRFDETPANVVIEKVSAQVDPLGVGVWAERFEVLGDGAVLAVDEARTALTDILPSEPAQALTMADLVTATGATKATLQRALKDVSGLQQLGKGVKGDPLRYFRTGEGLVSAQSPTPRGLNGQNPNFFDVELVGV